MVPRCIPARLLLVSFFLYLSVAFAMAFRPNCGRPFDHPRWADGDPLARAFIIEMKDDLAVYLTNMNAAIHGIGTSLKGTLLDGEHRKKYEKMYNRLLVWRIEEIMYVELPKRQREKEVKWSTDVYTDICTAIWYYLRESEKIMMMSNTKKLHKIIFFVEKKNTKSRKSD